jgi:hypothetical protein
MNSSYYNDLFFRLLLPRKLTRVISTFFWRIKSALTSFVYKYNYRHQNLLRVNGNHEQHVMSVASLVIVRHKNISYFLRTSFLNSDYLKLCVNLILPVYQMSFFQFTLAVYFCSFHFRKHIFIAKILCGTNFFHDK